MPMPTNATDVGSMLKANECFQEEKSICRDKSRKPRVYEAPAEPRMTRSRAAQLKSDLANDNSSAAAALIAGRDITDDPETIEEALASKNSNEWRLAIRQEYESLLRKKTWALAQKKDIPAGQRLLSVKLVFKTKRDKEGKVLKYKVRCCVRGFEQKYGVDYEETFAGVARSETWKVAVALAALHGLEMDQMDVITTFLNNDMDKEVYVMLPPFWEKIRNSDYVGKLLRGMYGPKQAPRLWQQLLAKQLATLGFKPLTADPGTYVHESTGFIIVIYVDDILLIGKQGVEFDKMKKQLLGLFETEDMGPAAYYLGVRIVRDWKNDQIILCQDAYAKKLLNRFGMENCHPVSTPFEPGALINMIPYDEVAPKKDITLYQSIIGSVMYLASKTRPDILWTCGVLSRFNHNPSPQHLRAAKRVLQYLKGTINLGCHSTRKSTWGYVFFFGGGVISAASKRFESVAQSTTEAEFYALGKASMEASWLRMLLKQLGYEGEDAKKIKIY
ncbi:hypothetical protein K3495_g2595 [Podosphaera aphanis]|nr:hypothetical protein K3495_g2595 [Podosphaera aphanis]